MIRILSTTMNKVSPAEAMDHTEEVASVLEDRNGFGIKDSLHIDSLILCVGTAGKVMNKSKSKFYPGKITKCRFDGAFDILYDNGEHELKIRKDMICSSITTEGYSQGGEEKGRIGSSILLQSLLSLFQLILSRISAGNGTNAFEK